MKRRILGQRWESLKMFQNITPHFCDRTRWTRCAQIVSRYFAALSKCERRKNSLTSAFVLLWKERMRSGGLKYASPLKKRAKATPFGFCLKHCLRQLRNSSPKIYSCYDRQLYSGLQISHKIVAGWRGQLQGFINLAKSHESSSACCSFTLARRGTFCGALREGVNGKKRFLSGIARMMGGGGLPMPEFFGPLFRSAFLVNKKSLFPQKCQCIELLTVF